MGTRMFSPSFTSAVMAISSAPDPPLHSTTSSAEYVTPCVDWYVATAARVEGRPAEWPYPSCFRPRAARSSAAVRTWGSAFRIHISETRGGAIRWIGGGSKCDRPKGPRGQHRRCRSFAFSSHLGLLEVPIHRRVAEREWDHLFVRLALHCGPTSARMENAATGAPGMRTGGESALRWVESHATPLPFAILSTMRRIGFFVRWALSEGLISQASI